MGKSVPSRQRVVAVLHTEGLVGLVQRIGSRLGRRPRHVSCHVFALLLDHPIRSPLPRVAVDVKQLGVADDDDLDALVEADVWGRSRPYLLARLAEGQQCYVVKYQDQIVAGNWCVMDGEFKDPDLERTFHLAANEVYCHSAFTIPAFRGKGIFSYLRAETARHIALTPGKNRTLGLILDANKAALRSCVRVGEKRVGRVGFVEVLGVRFHYCWGPGVFRKTMKRFFIE